MAIPYVWGGSTPSGFDCSGLTSYNFNQIGIGIGRTTIAQEAHVQSTDISDASQVAAPQPGQNVSIQAVSNYFKPSFVGRVVR